MIFESDSEGTCEITSIQADGVDYAGTMFAGLILEEMYSNIE